MGGLANGISQLFKAGRTRIGNAIDNYLLDAESRKAIEDEVRKKFQSQIDLVDRARSKRAANLTELGKKLADSKKALQDAQDNWNKKYAAELAAAKNQRQTDINNYDTELKNYQNAVNNAKQGKQSIVDQLNDLENIRDPYRTLYTDVKSGDNYVLHPITHKYINITKLYPKLSEKEARNLSNRIQNYETRLWDQKSGKVINAFDESNQNIYGNGQYNAFDSYLNIRQGQNATLLRDLSNADNQLKQAKSDLKAWNKQGRPKDWDDTTPGNNDLTRFETNFKANNGDLPTTYRFNGHDYANATDLNKDYQDAVTNAQNRLSHANKKASEYATKRDAEIAKRIQDAKDMKKAKLALGGALGAGALAAGAAAMYGGDDTDTTDTTDNIDNSADAYTGEPDPGLKLENTPEGKAALNGKSLIDTDFDPDKAEAEAILAGAAYDKGVEDGNSVRASDIVTADGRPIDDGLFELLKAMKDPYKADAIANYIYSRHGDDPEVQRLGWRGWLNRYGDSLRSKMDIDPSGYKGMHVSGGL